MFNRLTARMATAFAVAITTLASPSVQATAVTSTAAFTDISLFGITASNHQYFVEATTPFFSDFDFALTPLSFNTSTPAGVSFAQIQDIFAPLPGTSAGATTKGEGHATALWTFDWTATSTGTASVNLEYLFDATIFNLLAGDRAIARSYFSIGLDGTSLFNSALYTFDSVENNVGGFDYLGLSFNVQAGETGSLTMALNSDAYVAAPEPSTLPLLGCALAGLIVFRRRIKGMA